MIKTIKLPLLLRILRQFNFPRKLGVLEKLYARNLSAHGVSWVECANGVTWKLDLNDPCHRWIVNGKYEGGEGIDLAASALKNGGVYVDSGANIGQWLLYLGHIERLTALAVEPVNTQRAWLQECVDHQDHWGIDIINSGLGSQDAELEIQLNGARSTLQMDWYTEENFQRQTITIRRLEDILEERNIETVDFWKLDTEGAEFEALLGAKKYLQNHAIKHIYFECHPSNYKEIHTLLSDCNYRIYYLSNHQLQPKTDQQLATTQDLVAIPLGA